MTMKNIFENVKFVALGVAVLSLVLAGCQVEKDGLNEDNGNQMQMRFAVSRLSGDMASGDDAGISSLTGFRVTEGKIVERFEYLTINEKGWCTVNPEKKEGTIYFVANGSEADGLANVNTLEELLALELAGEEMTDEGVAMTGKIDLTQSSKEVRMKRSVARVDVDARSAGVEVKEVVLGNVADRGMLWNENSVPVSAGSSQGRERTFSFNSPLAGIKQPICYLYEQVNDNLTVHIVADVEGVTYELNTKLPVGIRRNTVYTLKVNGVGGKLEVEVLEADWSGTDEVNAGEEKLEFTVDISASNLPVEVTVNERLDQVDIPYTATEFDLVMNTIAGTTLKISGAVDGVEVTTLSGARTAGNQFVVHVKNALKSFTDLGGNIQLEAVNADGVSVGEIVLSFDANPCRLTGDLVFDKDNYCRFDTQVEGELGILFIPDNMRVELRFDSAENENGKEWMKMEQREDGSYRLLAGWCETYKKAMNGKTEAVQLVIIDEKNQEVVYTMTRPYRSIPTVKVDGNYWSIFPMVGNSKNLAEQIDMEISPDDLMDYLMTCSDEEFVRLQGSHYQGGIPNAVTIGYDEAKQTFAYKGFTEAASSMYMVDDEDMLPEGWRLPLQTELAELSWGASAYSQYWDGVNKVIGANRYYVRERKNIQVDGYDYGKAYVWSVQRNSSSRLIFSGFPPQLNTSGISSYTSLVPAARGTSSSCWEFEVTVYGGLSVYGFVRYRSYPIYSTYTMHSIKVLPEYVYQ